MEPTNLQKAIAMASKASQEDQDGNYEEAVKSYQHAVKYFLHILKREPQGKEGNQKIRDKCKQYLDRVEELLGYLDKKKVDMTDTQTTADTACFNQVWFFDFILAVKSILGEADTANTFSWQLVVKDAVSFIVYRQQGNCV